MTMKKFFMLSVIVLAAVSVIGCANTGRYNTQKGAALGAGLGALAGQAIGHNTQSTVIGTGVGALLGSIIGNGIDQEADEYRNRDESRGYSDPYYSGEYSGGHENYDRRRSGYREPPPGEWVMVPGHWQGRRWVPAHEVWRPIDPRY